LVGESTKFYKDSLAELGVHGIIKEPRWHGIPRFGFIQQSPSSQANMAVVRRPIILSSSHYASKISSPMFGNGGTFGEETLFCMAEYILSSIND
jgi:hypothetical protein